MGVLTLRASDIDLVDEQLCEAVGYLSTPGRIIRIEAQVPYSKIEEFKKAYPRQQFYAMEPWANKQSYQFRILMNSIKNCPEFLLEHITCGGGQTAVGCISRGLFVEKLVEKFGFKFQVEYQNTKEIIKCVEKEFPELMEYFYKGFNLGI